MLRKRIVGRGCDGTDFERKPGATENLNDPLLMKTGRNLSEAQTSARPNGECSFCRSFSHSFVKSVDCCCGRLLRAHCYHCRASTPTRAEARAQRTAKLRAIIPCETYSRSEEVAGEMSCWRSSPLLVLVQRLARLDYPSTLSIFAVITLPQTTIPDVEYYASWCVARSGASARRLNSSWMLAYTRRCEARPVPNSVWFLSGCYIQSQTPLLCQGARRSVHAKDDE